MRGIFELKLCHWNEGKAPGVRAEKQQGSFSLGQHLFLFLKYIDLVFNVTPQRHTLSSFTFIHNRHSAPPIEKTILEFLRVVGENPRHVVKDV